MNNYQTFIKTKTKTIIDSGYEVSGERLLIWDLMRNPVRNARIKMKTKCALCGKRYVFEKTHVSPGDFFEWESKKKQESS